MKCGDVIFVQGKGLLPWLIRLFDRGKFSHVCIAMNATDVIEAQYNELVSIKPFDKSLYKYKEVIDLGLTQDQKSAVYQASLKLIGRRYDCLQDLWYVLKDVFHLRGVNFLNNKEDMICSELVYTILDVTGIWEELNVRECSVRGVDLTPNQLYDLVKYLSIKN
jgi:hypothetical protein